MSRRVWPGLLAFSLMACAHTTPPNASNTSGGAATGGQPAAPSGTAQETPPTDPALQALAIRCVAGDSEACLELSGKMLIDRNQSGADRLLAAWRARGETLPKAGEVVRRIAGFEARSAPSEGVLLEVFKEPVGTRAESGSPHFGAAYDARLGYLDPHGGFRAAPVDRRFYEVQAEGSTPLREAYRSYAKVHRFKVGDLVAWKPGLRNRVLPGANELAIVMRVEEKPVFDASAELGSDTFREPLELVLGVLNAQGDLISFYFSASRMEPTTETSGRAAALKDALKRFQAAQRFKPGQLVRWKAGLSNRDVPARGAVGIVVEMLDRPVIASTATVADSAFNEPLTVTVGVLDNDEDLLIYHLDARRLEATEEGGTEVDKLRSRFTSLTQKHVLRPGDLVTWKSGLRNKTLPMERGVGIVIEVLERPVFDEAEQAGSSYFNERLDLRLGVIGSNGEFAVYHYDQRRFEPYRTTVAGRE